MRSRVVRARVPELRQRGVMPPMVVLGAVLACALVAYGSHSGLSVAGRSAGGVAFVATTPTDPAAMDELPSSVVPIPTVAPTWQQIDDEPPRVVAVPVERTVGMRSSEPAVASATSSPATVSEAPSLPRLVEHDAEVSANGPHLVGTGCVSLAVVGAAFAPDSANLSADVVAALHPHVAALIAAGRDIEVGGHTDERRTSYAGGNQQLSEDRAEAVARVLRNLGVPDEHLIVVGFADRQPIDARSTIDAYAKNRRVEIEVSC